MKTDINQLRKVVVLKQARYEELTGKASQLRDAIRQEDRITTIHPDSKPHVHKAFNERVWARQAKAVELRKDLETTEKEIAAIERAMADAGRKIADIEQASDQNRRENISRVIQKAAQSAPGKEEFIAASVKLNSLRERCKATDKALDEAFAAGPKSQQDRTEISARKLLETGFLDDIQTSPDGSARIKDLTVKLRALIVAVRLQENVVDLAQRRYTSEIVRSLQPFMAALVSTIHDSYGAAREAMVQARLLRTALAVETRGSNEAMPCLEFYGVQMPAGTGITDGFTGYRDMQIRAGLL